MVHAAARSASIVSRALKSLSIVSPFGSTAPARQREKVDGATPTLRHICEMGSLAAKARASICSIAARIWAGFVSMNDVLHKKHAASMQQRLTCFLHSPTNNPTATFGPGAIVMVTISSTAAKGFEKGRSVYTCDCCGRRTRETTVFGSDMCADCHEMAGLQNCVWDGCFTDADLPDVDRLLTKIVKAGGSEARLRSEFRDLFAAAT